MRDIVIILLVLSSVRCQPKAHIGSYLITEFGAKGDGLTMNTPFIQKAIDRAGKDGGGKVVIPPGKFLSGTIFLRDDITLELESGAVLLGSENLEDFPLVESVYYKSENRQKRHFVIISKVRNVTIEGAGTIDGQGYAFWEEQQDSNKWIRPKKLRPAAMVMVNESRDVMIENVHLTNPPEWTINLHLSERVHIRGISIVNNDRSPNADGIDISSSSDVIISDCYINTTDDAIVMNTAPGRPVKRIAVTNCIIRTLCAAFKIGWPTQYADISQVTFSNSVIWGSNRGVAIYSCSGTNIEDVTVNNIVFDSNTPVVLTRPIQLDQRAKDPGGRIGEIRDVTITNFKAKTQGRIVLTAENGSMMKNIALRDITMEYPYIEDPVLYGENSISGQFAKANKAARMAKAAVVAENIRDLHVKDLRITWPDEEVPEDWQLQAKIENGSFDRIYYPDYSNPRPVEFSAVWGRNLEGGLLDVPLAAPSSVTNTKIDLEESSIEVVR